MNRFFLILLFSASLIYSQKLISPDSAYRANSIELLINTFDQWIDYPKSDNNQDVKISYYMPSKPTSSEKINKSIDIIKYTYEIFEDFYDPKIFKDLKDSFIADSLSNNWYPELGDTLYNNIRYVLIQNKIKICVYDSLLESFYLSTNKYMFPNFTIEILDFHPKINIPDVKVIYLEDWLKCVLGEFLINKYIPIGEDLFWMDDHITKDAENKLNFLNRVMRIYYDRTCSSWIVETPPSKVSINYNKRLTSATVEFMLINQAGTAYYKRVDEKWNYLKSRITSNCITID